MTDPAKRALVIIPTYDERENLLLIAELMRQPNVQAMVVEDQSPRRGTCSSNRPSPPWRPIATKNQR